MKETWVRSLGWEDPLEKEMATHSSVLAWRISWTEEPGGLQSRGLQEFDTTEQLSTHHKYAPSWGTADVRAVHQTPAIWTCPSGSSQKTRGSRGV